MNTTPLEVREPTQWSNNLIKGKQVQLQQDNIMNFDNNLFTKTFFYQTLVGEPPLEISVVGIKVVTEDRETQQKYELLRILGRGQGDLFSKPLTIDNMTSLLKNTTQETYPFEI